MEEGLEFCRFAEWCCALVTFAGTVGTLDRLEVAGMQIAVLSLLVTRALSVGNQIPPHFLFPALQSWRAGKTVQSLSF